MPFLKTIIIDLGGSIVVSKKGEINIDFLKKFRKLILKFVKKGYRFVIVVGGGRVARTYQQAASKIINSSFEDLDWLGILATRINAHLLQMIFKEKADKTVITNPYQPLKTRRPIIVAAGWKPGFSTDYDAVLLAKRFRVKEIIDVGNIPFVFREDPELAKKKGRKPVAIKQISWKDYRQMISRRWRPGLSAPIDPIAAKEAQKSKIRAIVIMGRDLKNLKSLLLGKDFSGTVIS